MSTHATDETNDGTRDEQPRYADLTIGEDEFVIYDRQNHQSWIQSTVAVDVARMR